MRSKIVKIGSDCGIILGKSILEALNIPLEAEVEIIVEGETLVVRPIRDTSNISVAMSFQHLMDHPEELAAASSHWFG